MNNAVDETELRLDRFLSAGEATGLGVSPVAEARFQALRGTVGRLRWQARVGHGVLVTLAAFIAVLAFGSRSLSPVTWGYQLAGVLNQCSAHGEGAGACLAAWVTPQDKTFSPQPPAHNPVPIAAAPAPTLIPPSSGATPPPSSAPSNAAGPAANPVQHSAPATAPSATAPPPAPALVQAITAAQSTRAGFSAAVTAGHTLIGLFAVGGGSGCTVSSVTDSQGNVWTRAIQEFTTWPDDSEVWYTTAKTSGSDTVSASITTGYSATNLTLAEFSGHLTYESGAGGGGQLATNQKTASAQVSPGDVIVELYSDGGANTGIVPADGSTAFASTVAHTVQEESAQSYRLTTSGSSYSAAYTTSGSVRGALVFAAFRAS